MNGLKYSVFYGIEENRIKRTWTTTLSVQLPDLAIRRACLKKNVPLDSNMRNLRG